MHDHEQPLGLQRERPNWKSAHETLCNLIDIASKGGNYLLNVGPTSEGLIPQPSVERLAQIGKWMKINGEAIYGTARPPFPAAPAWGRITQKPGKLYPARLPLAQGRQADGARLAREGQGRLPAGRRQPRALPTAVRAAGLEIAVPAGPRTRSPRSWSWRPTANAELKGRGWFVKLPRPHTINAVSQRGHLVSESGTQAGCLRYGSQWPVNLTCGRSFQRLDS